MLLILMIYFLLQILWINKLLFICILLLLLLIEGEFLNTFNILWFITTLATVCIIIIIRVWSCCIFNKALLMIMLLRVVAENILLRLYYLNNFSRLSYNVLISLAIFVWVMISIREGHISIAIHQIRVIKNVGLLGRIKWRLRI